MNRAELRLRELQVDYKFKLDCAKHTLSLDEEDEREDRDEEDILRKKEKILLFDQFLEDLNAQIL